MDESDLVIYRLANFHHKFTRSIIMDENSN